ncbi:MAG TPA: hypothetical protein VGS03_18285 [Candidatus Polarisedimenticolia bacterium]|jgi:hypothetical protein|nr:hypothetical protein [Candidatus Polarisedimenticolia bacterium]
MIRMHAAAAAVLLGLALAPVPARAADEAPASPETQEPSWETTLTGNGYLFPGEGDFLLGIAAAEHGPLHLEGRFNYEDRDTVSFFVGWNWSTGKTVELTVTPMLGAAAGDTDAVVPGLELSLAWKQLDYYLEGEVLFDLHDHADDFVYGWSELGWTPYDWLRVGFVGQRTRTYDTGLDIQRGLLFQGLAGGWSFGVDWFNPRSDDEFTVAVLEVTF